mgnify:CR=1 FL=1
MIIIIIIIIIRTVYPIPTTCADFSLILFFSFPRGYSYIRVVAGTYKENSLKIFCEIENLTQFQQFFEKKSE